MSDHSDILKEVYQASGKNPNTVPEKELAAKARKKSAFFNILLILLGAAAIVGIIFLVIFLSHFVGRSSSAEKTADAQSTAAVQVEKPALLSDTMEGTNCTIALKKGTYDIDWAKIHAKDASGAEVAPVSYDEAASAVTFSLTSGTLNIYIPDIMGNEAQLVLQPSS